ncbi:protein S100-A1-like [Antennarius striatus]|uniref:protein S100-A1-like n=1 Tax=Antennarius striatus TaxID=241820 RepID=UPI0035B467FB
MDDKTTVIGVGLSKLQFAMQILMDVFHKYAKEDDKLNKGELKCLLKTELKELIDTDSNPQALDELMAELDCNQDGVVDFMEYSFYVAMLTVLLHAVKHTPPESFSTQEQHEHWQEQQQQRCPPPTQQQQQ